MTVDEAIKSAIDAIGREKPKDYVISPASHAEEFRETAPHLSAILSSSAIITTAEQYEEEDRNALAAQRKFKRISNRVNATVLVTGVLIALVLVTGTLANSPQYTLEKILFITLGLGCVATGALASRDMFIIKQGQLLERWMSNRASAETTRLNYFEAIAKATPPPAAENAVPAELLKLEYFRRFQLDVQRVYYRERSKDHRKEAEKTLSYSSWAIAGAAIATGFAGVLGGAIQAEYAVIAALGTMFAGLSTFASTREAVNQDRRNAERYERTARVLEDLFKRIDDVRNAVYATGSKSLIDFLEAVHEQLSLEHRQWLGELSEARGAFARLESTLREYSSQSPLKS